MANSLLVHSAIFAVGALIGGGVATAVAKKKDSNLPHTSASLQQPSAPILQVRPTTGNAVIDRPNVGVIPLPLKYGNPGV